MSEKRKISLATLVMAVATSLSRVGGLIRDVVVATIFGAGFATDAFFMAFTIPNLLRRFFAEGSLTAAFVPTFSEVYHKQGKSEACRIFHICLTLLVLVMLGVVVAGVLGSPWIVKGIGYGFGAVEGKLALTDLLNRVMFPYIFLVSLLALVTGVLNVLGHYFLPAVSPLFLNLSIIACALLLVPYFDVPVMALAVGVLLGGVLQLLIQLPVLKKKGVSLRPDFNFSDPAVKRIALLMLPGIAGVAIYQINVVVTRLLASFLGEGSVSWLYYGQRLFEFPQGIFIVSLAQAVLPSMSRQAAEGDLEGLKDSLRFSLSLIFLVTLPAAAGMTLCAVPVYSLFFMGGAFSFYDVQQTALALAAYAPGLVFVGVSRVVVPTFYSLKDTRTPVWVSLGTLLVNAGLGFALMQWYAHVGLALALTVSAIFNSVVLLILLRHKIGSLQLRSFAWALLRIVPATAVMIGVVQQVLRFGVWERQGMFWHNAPVLFAAVLAGGAVYGGLCYVLKVPELAEALAMVKRKVQRRRGA